MVIRINLKTNSMESYRHRSHLIIIVKTVKIKNLKIKVVWFYLLFAFIEEVKTKIE